MRVRVNLRVVLFTVLLLTLGRTEMLTAQAQSVEPHGAIESTKSLNELDTKMIKPKNKISEVPKDSYETLPRNFSGLAERFVSDQEQIWTSPSKILVSDTQWLVPTAGITAGLITTDASYNRQLSHDPSTLSRYNNLSNASVAALIGGAGGMWLLSYRTHNEHWRETGFLAGEAAINSLVVVESLKYSFRRERPYQGDGSGSFFQSGGTSFPSEHAAAAWAVAGVIAHEYPGPLPKLVAYSLASLATFSRVRAQKHFPSDVFVGTVVGNLIAQDIYSRHHDSSLGGSEWRSISQIFRGDGTQSVGNLGSPYVPLDSWIYPAFERLAALGAIQSEFLGMRPWTRNECVRILGEANDGVEKEGIGGSEAQKLYRSLELEFRGDMEELSSEGHSRARVDSVYSRLTGISGQPLTDGNHFGQTLINDFGRPYQEGFNVVEGVSAWTTSGHWVGYLRAEYEHAPSAPAPSEAVRDFIASVDNVPGVPPATPYSAVNRVQLLDAYIGLNFENWQMTFGKQSLTWGSTQGGPFIFSDDAVPINMIRLNRVSPFKP